MWIRDEKIRIRDGKIRIRKKHPGSVTLLSKLREKMLRFIISTSRWKLLFSMYLVPADHLRISQQDSEKSKKPIEAAVPTVLYCSLCRYVVTSIFIHTLIFWKVPLLTSFYEWIKKNWNKKRQPHSGSILRFLQSKSLFECWYSNPWLDNM